MLLSIIMYVCMCHYLECNLSVAAQCRWVTWRMQGLGYKPGPPLLTRWIVCLVGSPNYNQLVWHGQRRQQQVKCIDGCYARGCSRQLTRLQKFFKLGFQLLLLCHIPIIESERLCGAEKSMLHGGQGLKCMTLCS